MISKMVQYAAYAAAAWVLWWLWNGPIHDMNTISPQEKLAQWERAMKTCLKGEQYRLGATGSQRGGPEAVCADRLDLYLEDGVWYARGEPKPRVN